MTPEEFEQLQVGDVVRKGCETWVVFEIDKGEAWIVKQIDGEQRPLDVDDLDIDMWSVVSRVLSRENVNPKGGE